MSLAANMTVGPYQIIEPIGAGGMGEVYKARDTRLNRVVAIKILAGQLSDRPEARARFEREAQTIARLNHPHICVLYDIGQHEGTDFLVMEFIEGETLAHRLERGPLPLQQALTFAVQIADALDKAHREGIVHRDLKPGNIMIAKNGVKLLDFGLAKLRETSPLSGLSAAPTNVPVTAAGAILGTLQYMAPEQLEGVDADARTDIFAFGNVLYEMLTGRKAFEGKSQMSLAGAILKDTPRPVSQFQPAVSPQLERLVATCLSKNPDDRWQAIGDLQRELQWLITSSALPSEVSSDSRGRKPRPRTLWIGSAALLGMIVGVILTLNLRPKDPASTNGSEVIRLSVLPPSSGNGRFGQGTPPALSPDGSHLAFVSGGQIYVRAMDTLEPIALDRGNNPFFSPDGQWVGFFSGGNLKKIPVKGGAAQIICDAAAAGASWGPDSVIYFAATNVSGLFKVPADGGEPTAITTLDRNKGEVSHRWPQVLPGGKALLFTVWTGPGFDERHLQVVSLESGERRIVVQPGSTGRYASSGHIIYTTGNGNLTAAPFDLDRLQLTGPPAPLGIRLSDETEGAEFTVSDSGTLAYLSGQPPLYRLVWVDRKGNVESLSVPPRHFGSAAISPDGRYAAATVIGDTLGIWILDLTRGTLTPLTTPGSSQAAVWSPDGKKVVYRATRMGYRNLYWKAVDGSGDEERLTTNTNIQTPSSWSPDNKWIAFTEGDLVTGNNIWILPTGEDRTPRPFLRTDFAERNLAFSPDGKWVAYVSNESGRDEIYVRPYPGPGGKIPVSTDGGNEPLWSRDGKELFFITAGAQRMMVVDVVTRPSFSASVPRLVFEGRFAQGQAGGSSYDVGTDGRFLRMQPVENDTPASYLTVVIHWAEELKRLVPASN